MAEKSLTSVGFVGLGNMGGAIAERLARAGVLVHVCDTKPGALARLVECGATPHPTPRSVADAASIVFACLPTVTASSTVALGADGLCEGRMIRHYVEMATVGSRAIIDVAAHLARRGIATLDAPVSGGAAAALRGNLTIMTGGPVEVFEAVRPTLLVITANVIPIGPHVGDGQTMKLVNNLLAAANMATAFEALVVGVKLGLAPSVMSDVISRSSGASTGFTARRIDAIRTRRFDNGGHIALLAKDIDLAFEQAREAGIDTGCLTSLTGMRALWIDAVNAGMSHDDVTSLVRLVETRLGVVAVES